MPQERLHPILGLQGVDERLIPGIIQQTTRDSRNVWYRYGQVLGRNGLETLYSGQSAAADSVDGLFPYTKIGGTKYLIRVTQTTVAEYREATNVWTVITGTALTGTAGTLVDHTVIDDTVIFTNGKDRVRKWAGAGNTAEIAASVNVWSKTCEAYVGFLMLGNYSTDGTTFNGVTIIFADDWDSSDEWDPCQTNLIKVDETPGEILAMKVLDRSLMVYKRDGVVKITFATGQVRFRHDLMPFDLGILAPHSLVAINRVGHIFLATDKQLYLNDGTTIRALPENLFSTLRGMDNTNAPNAQAGHDFIRNHYSLFMPGSSGADNMDKRIDFNYRTQQFSVHDYNEDATDIHRVSQFDFATAASAESVLVAAGDDKLVYRLDSDEQDNGITFTKYWTSDWTNLGFIGDKMFAGCTLSVKRSVGARMRVSVAQDQQKTFRHAQLFDLSGTDVVSDEIVVKYRITPILGHNFNIKVDFYHDVATAVTELRYVFGHYIPVSGYPAEQQPESQVLKS
jgi:hypothetical protein